MKYDRAKLASDIANLRTVLDGTSIDLSTKHALADLILFAQDADRFIDGLTIDIDAVHTNQRKLHA